MLHNAYLETKNQTGWIAEIYYVEFNSQKIH